MVSSGIRWYRTLPSELTQTVIAANKALWTGGDPNAEYPYSQITQIETFSAQQSQPVSFAPTYDPAINAGSGGDILVLCGFTGDYSFATQTFIIYGNPVVGQAITVTMVNGADTVVSDTYTTVATDTRQSVADQIVTLINTSAAVTPGTPFLTQAYDYLPTTTVNPRIAVGALNDGAGGNAITVNIVINPTATDGSKVAVTPLGATNLTGGGLASSAPLKYDGTNVSGLSSQITQAFTNCVTWHNHVWYWGDPANPDTLYASDIDQPEGWSFMTTSGGYQIGAGDGDPIIRACVPIGNILYVFKSNGIYAITGYDFQTGEYEFQVQPAFQGVGTPNAQSVCVVKNQIIFWSGSSFYRFAPGAFTLEYIGRTIPVIQGQISNGDQSLIRAVGGDFIYESNLNESYSNTKGLVATELYSSVAFFAFDVGHGVADAIVVYDDDASQYLGNYAWSVWTGWQVDGWVPFGGGPSSAGAPEEPKLLCWLPPAPNTGPLVNAFGTDPAADSGLPIPFLAQTGWATLGTAAEQKPLHRIFLEVEATTGVYISFTVTPDILVNQNGNVTNYAPQMGSFGATGSAVGAETHQVLLAVFRPNIPAGAWIFAFGENTGTANFELVELTVDYIGEALTP